MLRHFCDGCPAPLGLDAVADSYKDLQALLAVEPTLQPVIMENGEVFVFCSKCRPRMAAFLRERLAKFNELTAQTVATLANHKKAYWSQDARKKPAGSGRESRPGAVH